VRPCSGVCAAKTRPRASKRFDDIEGDGGAQLGIMVAIGVIGGGGVQT